MHLVDDDASVRKAIGRLLRAAGYEVAIYESAHHFLARLPDKNQLGCILLDLKMPELNGRGLQKRLIKMRSILPIIFLTAYGDIQTAVLAIKAGAEEFLTKPVSKDVLLGAIERALARHRQIISETRQIDTLQGLVDALTPREREVFNLVVRGKMNKQIARQLGTTERTIKAHRQRVMAKVGVQSVAELASVAARLGILNQDDPAAQKNSESKVR